MPHDAPRPAPGLRIHALPAVGHRRDPQVLQLLPRHARCSSRSTSSARQWSLARRGGRARVLRARRSSSGIRSRAHRRARRAPCTATRSRATATPASSSTSRSAAWRSSTARRSRCGRSLYAVGAGDRPGRDRRRGRAARGAHRVRRQALAPDALVRPPAHGRRQPARVRRHPPHDPAAVRPDVRRPDASSGEEIELRMGFSLRGVEQARANLHADCGDRARPASTPRRRPHHEAWRNHLDRDRRRAAPRSERETVFATGALPLAHQAVLRTATRARSGRRRAVRVRHLARCGTSTDPAAAAHGR